MHGRYWMPPWKSAFLMIQDNKYRRNKQNNNKLKGQNFSNHIFWLVSNSIGGIISATDNCCLCPVIGAGGSEILFFKICLRLSNVELLSGQLKTNAMELKKVIIIVQIRERIITFRVCTSLSFRFYWKTHLLLIDVNTDATHFITYLHWPPSSFEFFILIFFNQLRKPMIWYFNEFRPQAIKYF